MLYRYSLLIKKEEKYEITMKEYDIILCTCNETCSYRFGHLKERIAQCIIDECGMATEPETIAAASMSDHIVLIGDHMQLQPVIKYNAARECGLTTSLFERYADMQKREELFGDLLITLNVQYRMVCY